MHLNSTKQKNSLTTATVLKAYSDYDLYGNSKSITTKYYEGDDETEIDVYSTENYVYESYGAWCNNKVASQTVTKYNVNGSEARTTTYGYDTNGNLTQVVKDPSDVDKLTTNYSSYDDFGHPLNIEYVANDTTRSTSYIYSDDGRFLETKTNDQTGFSTTYDYEVTTGLLLEETDYLDNSTSYEYDAFNRLIKTSYPDGGYTVNALQWNNGDGPDDALYYEYEETSGSSPLWTWYDELGREIRKDYYGFDESNKLYITKSYNLAFQLESVSDPYYESATDIDLQSYTYDDEGRVSTLTTTAGSTSYTYNGLSTTIATPSDERTTTKNAAGQLVSSELNGQTVAFEYWPSGLTKNATPQMSGAVAVYTEFNLQGHRTELVDPDAGTITSDYNGFGEPRWELYTKTYKDEDEEEISEEILTQFYYDDAGRNYKTIVNDVATETGYDETTGFVNSVIKDDGHEVYYTYDEDSELDLGRVTTLTEKVDGTTFPFNTTYDSFGREETRTYPSGFSIANTYTSTGYLKQVSDESGSNIWRGDVVNTKGQFTQCTKGTNVITFGYDSKNLPKSIYSEGIISRSYSFNTDLNLESRTDNLLSQSECFTYDTYNQLYTYTVNSGDANTMIYNAHGNITGKTDVGYTMGYDAEKVHALTSIAGVPDLISEDEQSITYTDFKKLETISEGSNYLELSYGIDNQRRKSVMSVDDVTLTRYYLGDYEEESSTSETDKIHYISGGNGLAAIYIETDGVGKLYHAYTDYLGSLAVLTDEDGVTEEQYAFDPWGNRRDPEDWSQTDSRTSWLTNRGYTMHEHLDDFALINMNGRVYDPLVARFLSPDPQLQSPDNWLNYNRYTYCLNNPMVYTDPSGEVWQVIIGAVVGGTINLAMNWGDIDNLGEGILSFGVGAGMGALTAATGGATSGFFATAGGQAVVNIGSEVIIGVTNSIVEQVDDSGDYGDVDWGVVGTEGVSAIVDELVGGAAGNLVQRSGVANLLTNKIGLTGLSHMVVESAVEEGITGLATGFSTGVLTCAYNGEWDGGSVWRQTWTQGLSGFASGASEQLLTAGINSLGSRIENPHIVSPVGDVVSPIVETIVKESDEIEIYARVFNKRNNWSIFYVNNTPTKRTLLSKVGYIFF